MSRTISRRTLTTSSISGIAIALAGESPGSGGVAHAQTPATPEAVGTPTETLIGEALAPAWRFAVTIFEDPYRGTITSPAEATPGTRFVGVEVVITNDSDQPLEFRVANVRLLDGRGFNYPAGAVEGTEPRLVSQNLPDSERTRGWVWFMLPADSQVESIILNGPSPTFRIPITQPT